MRKSVTLEDKQRLKALLPPGTKRTVMNHAELRWGLGLHDWSNERVQKVLGRLHLDRYLKVMRGEPDARGNRSHTIIVPKRA